MGHLEDEGNLVQLLMLHSEDYAGLKYWFTVTKQKVCITYEIVNELIHLISNHVLCENLSEIREASFFSLITGECLDMKHCEQICVSIW